VAVNDDDPDALATELFEATVALTVELEPQVDGLRRPGPPKTLDGVPVAGVFEQPLQGRARHRSGRPSEPVVALAESAAAEARRRLGYGDDDNPALVPLALGAFYTVEARRTGALGLGDAARRGPPAARVLDLDGARRDPVLPRGAHWLRIWSVLSPEEHVCVELRYPVG
jgi:hypothetical protein